MKQIFRTALAILRLERDHDRRSLAEKEADTILSHDNTTEPSSRLRSEVLRSDIRRAEALLERTKQLIPK